MSTTINYLAELDASQQRHKEELAVRRQDLLIALRNLGVSEIDVQYEGYGDSGNVEDVTPTPLDIKLDHNLKLKLSDFCWDFAYDLSPGFENNEGGYGTLTWNVETDKIDVDHADRYVQAKHTQHEGL